MKVKARLPSSLAAEIVADLRRPHAFAFERIGFAFGRQGVLGSDRLVIVTKYIPVRDEHYLPDDSVGARIGSAALRSALERCLETGESAFHVHMHDVGVRLRFSSTDVHGLIELLPSFYGAAPQGPHGALLFSADTCSGAFWNPMLGRLVPMDSISVVGYPFRRSVGDGK